jgi:hypothetical protein
MYNQITIYRYPYYLKPDIIAITEVLPKNMRYTVNKAELDIEGYELFPGEFPIGAKRGIIIYVKKSLNAVEVKHFSHP